MAFELGQINEFSDPNSAADPVILTAAKAIRLPKLKGAFYQAMPPPKVSITQKKFEVRSRTKTVRDGKLGTTAWDDEKTDGLSIDAEALKGITVGSQLKAGTEIVVVKAVNRSAGTIDVFGRGFGGTAPAAHAAGSGFLVIGSAGRDVDLKNVDGAAEHTVVYRNGVQTVFHTFDWTRHGELVRKGVSPEQAQLLVYEEEMMKVAEDLARMSILGVRHIPDDYDDPFGSAGLIAQLQDDADGGRPTLSFDLKGEDLSEDKFKQILDEVFRYGNPDTVWCSQKLKKVFDAFLKTDTSHVITVERGERTAGGGIDSYEYNSVRLNLRVDADIPEGMIAIVNQSKCFKGWLAGDSLATRDEPAKSSREFRKSIQGSIGFAIEDVGYEHLLVLNAGSGNTERIYKTFVTGSSNEKS